MRGSIYLNNMKWQVAANKQTVRHNRITNESTASRSETFNLGCHSTVTIAF